MLKIIFLQTCSQLFGSFDLFDFLSRRSIRRFKGSGEIFPLQEEEEMQFLFHWNEIGFYPYRKTCQSVGGKCVTYLCQVSLDVSQKPQREKKRG